MLQVLLRKANFSKSRVLTGCWKEIKIPPTSLECFRQDWATNRLHTFQLPSGEFITDPVAMGNLAVNHFKAILGPLRFQPTSVHSPPEWFQALKGYNCPSSFILRASFVGIYFEWRGDHKNDVSTKSQQGSQVRRTNLSVFQNFVVLPRPRSDSINYPLLPYIISPNFD